MKNMKYFGILASLFLVFLVSCNKSDDSDTNNEAIVLPPFESMAYDFDSFTEEPGSAQGIAHRAAPNGNWVFSRIVVGVWNYALFTTLAVPVASFHTAVNHSPEAIGDLKWQWAYSVDGFTSEYTARLTGEIRGEEVIWEMYITKEGIEGFDEFLWFTGISALDGNSGQWILNESPERPHPILRINWERDGDDIASIRYTWVRELDANENDDPFKDSYLLYGLQEGDFDAYFDAYTYDENAQGFVSIRIEWNRSDYFGRVRAPQYFEDELWHCWDSAGDDTLCE